MGELLDKYFFDVDIRLLIICLMIFVSLYLAVFDPLYWRVGHICLSLSAASSEKG
jgi:hypothetical protein